MQAQKLSGLEPKAFMAYFEKICSIPHGSGNTKQISDYLVSFAKAHNLRYYQDKWNNVVIYVDATCGYEDHEPVILQGHLDMVCQKDDDCTIDMQTQGVDITHDGSYIYAKGTTLGADDGIAIAYGMALAADKTIAHPPLEILFTADEETTMVGATNIALSCLKGRRLINLDCGSEGSITISCVGGATADAKLPLTRKRTDAEAFRLIVDCLQGGHAGGAIGKRRANAHKVMGEFLSHVQKLTPIHIAEFKGGNMPNAITRTCEVTIVASGICMEQVNDIARQLLNDVQTQFDEPYAVLCAEHSGRVCGDVLDEESTKNVISFLNEIPYGVLTREENSEPKTTMNIGFINLTEDFQVKLSARSSNNCEKDALMEQMKNIVLRHNGSFHLYWQSAAWEPKKDSALCNALVRVYEDMYGKTPTIRSTRGILECGILCAKLPGVDCAAIGANMFDVHTSRERLEIASVKRTWDYLLEVLKTL